MQLRGLHYRQSCSGGAYYVCQNGFKGCCSINPCDPGATCPDTSSIPAVSTTARTTTSGVKSPTSASTSVSKIASSSNSSPSASRSSTPSGTMSPTSTRTSTTSALPTATSLTCPAANGTTYTDSNRVQYAIRCNADNSYASFNSTSVSTGGFKNCFPACDNFAACAGFTFVGSDSGNCYLKSDLPEDSYSSTSGSNFVTVALINRDAQVEPPTDALPTEKANSSSGSKSVPIGAIVGGVVGGLVALILLALLIFFCMRRRRRKQEEINLATQKPHRGAVESDVQHESPFAPLGGFYRGKSVDTPLPQHAPLDESLLAREDCVNGFVAAKHDRSAPDPVTGPAEMEGRPIYPTGTVGPVPVEMEAAPIMAPKTPMSPVVDESPVLGRHHSGAHAAQRHSNLMDDIRRRQHSRHIMSWNNYDDRSAISPPASMMTMSPRIGSPDVSPMLDQRSSSKSPPAHPN